MRSIDTNVIARWLLRDDPQQARVADDVMAQPVELTGTVALEIGWLMMSVGRMTPLQFADTMSVLLGIDTLYAPNKAGLKWAVDRLRSGADWADMVHIAMTQSESFASFDKQLRKQAGDAAPVLVETL